jgi:hypothetical protein
MQTWDNVQVEVDSDRIAWVTLNRPQKRNAMSPALNNDMVEVLNALEVDDSCAGADRADRRRRLRGRPAWICASSSAKLDAICRPTEASAGSALGPPNYGSGACS